MGGAAPHRPVLPHLGTVAALGELHGGGQQTRGWGGDLNNLLPFSEYKIHTFEEIETILLENGLNLTNRAFRATYKKALQAKALLTA